MTHPEPTEILVGDSITWTRRGVSVVVDGVTIPIKASAGWALKYVAVGRLGVITINATADPASPDDFLFAAAAATTAAYTVGDYKWQVVATKTTTRYTVAEGWVTLQDNIAVRNAAYDNRSHAKKVLDAIEAVIEGRATADQQAYTIAGRSLTRTPLQDLMKLRAAYRAEYETEQATANIAAGLSSKNKIYTRFI